MTHAKGLCSGLGGAIGPETMEVQKDSGFIIMAQIIEIHIVGLSYK